MCDEEIKTGLMRVIVECEREDFNTSATMSNEFFYARVSLDRVIESLATLKLIVDHHGETRPDQYRSGHSPFNVFDESGKIIGVIDATGDDVSSFLFSGGLSHGSW